MHLQKTLNKCRKLNHYIPKRETSWMVCWEQDVKGKQVGCKPETHPRVHRWVPLDAPTYFQEDAEGTSLRFNQAAVQCCRFLLNSTVCHSETGPEIPIWHHRVEERMQCNTIQKSKAGWSGARAGCAYLICTVCSPSQCYHHQFIISPHLIVLMLVHSRRLSHNVDNIAFYCLLTLVKADKRPSGSQASRAPCQMYMLKTDQRVYINIISGINLECHGILAYVSYRTYK